MSVINKLELSSIPNEYAHLLRLEKVLVSKRILFKKIAVVHGKGEFSKIKDTICNVPIEVDQTCIVLPRGSDSNGVVFVKLKQQ